MKSKSFKFITLPLLILMLLSIAFSAFRDNGEWTNIKKWDVKKLLNYIPFFSKSKEIFYIPSTQTQEIYVGEGEWNFKIDPEGYYEIPEYGLIRARGTEIPATGKKCWDTSILPHKDASYYGGILVNSRPLDGSVVKSNDRGCVEISLNLPKGIKEVKTNKKIKLIFTPS